jgi:A nuclease family of the HNH/ENDO VII superfamily with conserved AHH
VTDDHSQKNNPAVNNKSNTLIAGIPKPEDPYLRPVPNPSRKPNPLRIVPSIPQSPTTIPVGVSDILRGAVRIVPYVRIAVTANDAVILMEKAYELYQDQNREPIGQSGNLTFPEEPSPTPYVPPDQTTRTVGDPNRVDTVVRRRVNEVLGDSSGNTGNNPNSTGIDIRGNDPIGTRLDLDELSRVLGDPPGNTVNNPNDAEIDLARRNAETSRRNREAIRQLERVTGSNPDAELPVTTNDPNWMRPAENPNSPLDVPVLSPLPGLNLDGNQRPSISGDRSIFSQPRASQDAEPADSPSSPENSDQAEETPAGDENSGEPAKEAKKRAVEEAVVGQDIRSLPYDLMVRMRDIGYIISRGDKPAITYRGNLPSGNQLHLEQKDGIWTIQSGRSPTNTRISNQNEAKKNVLEGTGVKEIPEGYENNHVTPDAVWKNDPLLRQYDKNNGESGVDKAKNLVLMPKNKTAAINGRENSDVQTLNQKERLLNNVNHRGSHGKWSKHVADTYKRERQKLEDEYGALENVPKDVLKKTVEGIQDGLMNELREVDRKIERGDLDNLPDWIKDDGNNNPEQTPEHRLSNASSILDNQQLAIALGRAVRAKTKEVIAANTHSLEPSAISKDILNQEPTHKDLFQLLGISTLNSFQGTDANTMQNSQYQMKRLDAENIVITGLPDGKKIAVVNTRGNTIAMHGKPSPAQLEFLQNQLEQAKASLPVETVQNAAQERSSQNQMTM